MKKIALFPFALSFCLLAGCGQANLQPPVVPEPIQLDELRLELPRDVGGEPLLSAVEALPQALKAALAERGVEVERVSVSVGTSHAATAQALNEGGVDLAVLSGESLATFGADAVPLLTARTQIALPDSADAADWGESSWSDGGGQRLLILAGPSDYGRQLAGRTASPLTWEEVDHALWVTAATSGSMASVWIADRYEGNTLSDLGSLRLIDSSKDGGLSLLAALADGAADIAILPADWRIDLADDWTTTLGRTKPIWEETTVLGVTEKRYDLILAGKPGDETLSGEAFQTALAGAIEQVCADHADVSTILGGALCVPVTGGDLNGMRRLATLGG